MNFRGIGVREPGALRLRSATWSARSSAALSFLTEWQRKPATLSANSGHATTRMIQRYRAVRMRRLQKQHALHSSLSRLQSKGRQTALVKSQE